MDDSIKQVASALGRILAHEFYREAKELEAMQREVEALDAASTGQHDSPELKEATDHARGDIRSVQQRLAEPEVC
ncbi:hypothetical protein APY04_2323 [Hyphomicrobium sulfonivorans]|uniref:Uncharacterized protein n=1 Tax=Hyphomicrobium sulfonivorans TaxID=121290 RepID=A0A109BEL3_HYPSL|nr:hypothetical protein [Hyphomicrobium sulfonivorans]KWT66692.1 hypothetical protein APY04_2323 [Hyphomicrobium sulfonivorans]